MVEPGGKGRSAWSPFELAKRVNMPVVCCPLGRAAVRPKFGDGGVALAMQPAGLGAAYSAFGHRWAACMTVRISTADVVTR